MHDRHDENVIGFYRVQHSVGEDVNEAASDVVLKQAPLRWGVRNASNSRFDALDEPKVETRLTSCVVARRLFVLSDGLGMEPVLHRPTA